MRFEQARSEAIDGAHVRATDWQPGKFVSYAFAGLRVNFVGGSSSGWTPQEADLAADWEICGPIDNTPTPPLRDKWGRPV